MVNRKIILMMVLLLCVLLSACNPTPPSEIPNSSKEPVSSVTPVPKIGISLPDQQKQSWKQSGRKLKELLEASGYTVDLQYADADSSNQIAQLEKMISGGCDILVITPVDNSALSGVLKGAKENNENSCGESGADPGVGCGPCGSSLTSG